MGRSSLSKFWHIKAALDLSNLQVRVESSANMQYLKKVFYYSVPTLDFLHKHLWGPRNFQFVTMAVRGPFQPWKSPGRITKTSWAIELDIIDIWWKFQPDRTVTSWDTADWVKSTLLCSQQTDIGQGERRDGRQDQGDTHVWSRWELRLNKRVKTLVRRINMAVKGGWMAIQAPFTPKVFLVSQAKPESSCSWRTT